MSQQPNGIKFSIIVPVLQEAERINTFLERLVCIKSGKTYEVIVVDGDPSCSTINVITNSHIIKIASPAGRGRQMNAGADAAQGEILIFLHADTQLPPNALNYIEKTLQQKEYVAGAFDLDIASDHWYVKVVAAIARLRSRFTQVPYGDQAIFMKRDYFHQIGCFKEIPLMEDVELMQRIKKRGDRICILSRRIKTSDRRWQKNGMIHTTWLDILLPVLYKFGVSPKKLAKYYWKH
jgi:rSAM/selenodomain-associated transferase 2